MLYHTRPDLRKENVSGSADGTEEHKEREIEKEEGEREATHDRRFGGIRKVVEKYSD